MTAATVQPASVGGSPSSATYTCSPSRSPVSRNVSGAVPSRSARRASRAISARTAGRLRSEHPEHGALPGRSGAW